jgi:hypothetical protein
VEAIPQRKDSAYAKCREPDFARTRTVVTKRLARLAWLGEVRIGLHGQEALESIESLAPIR